MTSVATQCCLAMSFPYKGDRVKASRTCVFRSRNKRGIKRWGSKFRAISLREILLILSFLLYKLANPHFWICLKTAWEKWKLQPRKLTLGNTVEKAPHSPDSKSRLTATKRKVPNGPRSETSARNYFKYAILVLQDIRANVRGTVLTFLPFLIEVWTAKSW